MDNEELFKILGFIKISKLRQAAIMAIEDNVKTPSEIGKEKNIRTTQISYALIFLKKMGLVVCLNEGSHKGRLYTCTDYGKEIMKYYHYYFD